MSLKIKKKAWYFLIVLKLIHKNLLNYFLFLLLDELPCPFCNQFIPNSLPKKITCIFKNITRKKYINGLIIFFFQEKY